MIKAAATRLSMGAILVTGSSGFCGTHFIRYLCKKYRKIHILCLDRKPFSKENTHQGNERIVEILGDVRDEKFLRSVFERYPISHVFHLASLSSTDESLYNPKLFAEVNIIGTVNLLHAAYANWHHAPLKVKASWKKARFIYISTYEVYGSLGEYGLFREDSPFSPTNPHAASRASADLFVRSFHKTYGLNVITLVRPTVFGPGQDDEKLIPTIIRKALEGEIIPIYGDGRYTRSYLYIQDFCRALELVWKKGRPGERYLVGGGQEYEHIVIARKLCDLLEGIYPLRENRLARERCGNLHHYVELIRFVPDRPSHDRRYAVNSERIEKELGFTPNPDFDSQLHETVLYYLEKYRRR